MQISVDKVCMNTAISELAQRLTGMC